MLWEYTQAPSSSFIIVPESLLLWHGSLDGAFAAAPGFSNLESRAMGDQSLGHQGEWERVSCGCSLLCGWVKGQAKISKRRKTGLWRHGSQVWMTWFPEPRSEPRGEWGLRQGWAAHEMLSPGTGRKQSLMCRDDHEKGRAGPVICWAGKTAQQVPQTLESYSLGFTLEFRF
jgi:hypothetical protein